VPFSDVISISKKIKSNTERNRLRKIVESIKPKNFGVIIRTVSEGKGVAEMQKDLLDLYQNGKHLLPACQQLNPVKKYWAKLVAHQLS